MAGQAHGREHLYNAEFQDLEEQSQFRVCDYLFKSLFIGVTYVRPQPITNVLVKVFKFKSIIEIIKGNYSTD